MLRDVGSSYLDGAEEQVLRLIREATDRSSTSEELIAKASGWAQRYHLDPTRTNIMRALELPADARVLEIGAGCGAVTRYLGERCALVDAIEPVPSRAASAAARTDGLDSVAVFVGEIDDVPAEPAYDLVVVIGVLEYVGHGSADRAPYLAFLRKIADRLVDGGTLALAIENRLGVKYLAGSPEDHTNRPYDSLENYPHGGHARTFSRVELEDLFRASGLDPHTRSAFPDYKMTRAVLGEFPEVARSLLYRVPRFPSPDWRAPRPREAAEGPLWQTLVDARLEHEFGNSFLVLAGKGAPSRLWPDERAGVFFSSNRRAHLSVQTVIDADEHESVRLRRKRISTRQPADSSISVIESDTAYEVGVDFTAVLAERGVPACGDLLRQWAGMVDEACAADMPGRIDLVPHNLVVDADGQLRSIDVELVGLETSRDEIIRRGIFWLAHYAAPSAAAWRWRPSLTVGEVMIELGAEVGLSTGRSWIEQTILDEARLQVQVRTPVADRQAGLAAMEEHLRRITARRLGGMPLGQRLYEQAAQTSRDLVAARDGLAKRESELKRAKKSLQALQNSRAVRSARKARRTVDLLLPPGSARRAAVRRAARSLR